MLACKGFTRKTRFFVLPCEIRPRRVRCEPDKWLNLNQTGACIVMKTLIGMLMLAALAGCETVPKQVLPFVMAGGQGGGDLYLYDLESGASRALQKTPDVSEYDPSINPTSERVVYVAHTVTDGKAVYRLIIQDLIAGTREEVLSSRSPLHTPAFANDSKEIAYVVLRDGKLQIDVKDLTTQGKPKTIGFGSSPSWRVDDNAIFYSSADTLKAQSGDLMLHEVNSGLNNSFSLRGNAFANLPRGTSVAYTSLPYTRRNEAVWLLDANGRQKRLTSPGKSHRDSNPVHINGTSFIAFTRTDVETNKTSVFVVDRFAEDPVEALLFEASGDACTSGIELVK